MDNPIRLDDGTEWRFKDKYPLGLAPQFAGEVTDWSITTGWRTERDLGDGYSLTADLSARYGWDKIAYSMWDRSEEHTSELQSLMRNSSAVFCLQKKTKVKK